jgi:hypothetical protein
LQLLLLSGLVFVAALHVVSRLLGAAGGALWSLIALGYGMHMLGSGAELVFLGIPTTRWIFAAFMVALFGYHVASAARFLRAQAANLSDSELDDEPEEVTSPGSRKP